VRQLAILDLLADGSLESLSKKIAGQYADDLIQEVAVLILEMEDEKWAEINEGGYLRWYVVRTMMNMATSARSSFSRLHGVHQKNTKYKDGPDEEVYDHEKEADILKLETILETYHWYERDMLRLYLKEGSYRKVAKVTGIPFKSIGNTVKKTIENLRIDYYDDLTERLIRGSGLPYFRGGANDGLEDQKNTENT